MTIPTRDELIERAHAAWMEGCPDVKRLISEVIADFALAEIRRAVAEELEALSEKMRVTGDTRVIDARLAALRQTEQPPGSVDHPRPAPIGSGKVERHAEPVEAAGSTPAPGATYTGTTAGLSAEVPNGAGVSERTRLRDESPAGNVAAPALSDADVLERAASLMALHGDPHMQARNAHVIAVEQVSKKLRAASAPKPVDVFERVAMDFLSRATVIDNARLLAPILKENFGPLVEALDHIEKCSMPGIMRQTARYALSALRQRAQEASRG